MRLVTVTGSIVPEAAGIVDAHEHLWIAPPAGVPEEARFVLDDEDAIVAELAAFRAAGGRTLIDCQPGGCGRDHRRLVRLSRATGLAVTATTGFHLAVYYPPGAWLWCEASVDAAAAYFVRELTRGMEDGDGTDAAEDGPDADAGGVRAATLKAGYSAAGNGREFVLMEAVAEAAVATGAAVLVHTERGRGAERLPDFFARRGVAAERLYLCHMDKRPDPELHVDLALAGVLLGYDTFARPKYDPERGAWMLLETLHSRGLEHSVALGLDLAGRRMWRMGGGPGPALLPEQVVPRLARLGFGPEAVAAVAGGNVARRLARDG